VKIVALWYVMEEAFLKLVKNNYFKENSNPYSHDFTQINIYVWIDKSLLNFVHKKKVRSHPGW
jgi:hypothetical protein